MYLFSQNNMIFFFSLFWSTWKWNANSDQILDSIEQECAA